MALFLIDSAIVTVNAVTIKFGRTIKISSIKDSCFRLFTDEATPVETVSPFRVIDTLTDYNQVSRVLNLYWDNVLTPATDYVLKISGLLDSSGLAVPEEQITFTSSTTAATPSYIQETQNAGTIINEVLIEDKSVRADIETGYQIIAKNPNFYIEEVTPTNGDFYINNDENNGRVVVTFSSRPASNFLTSKFFKIQRKKIQKAPSRWENLSPAISMHSWKPDVYVDFPSNDSTPVYYVDGKTYFETGYKYRVIVSSEVGI